MPILINTEKWCIVTSDQKQIVIFKNRRRLLLEISKYDPCIHKILLFESKISAEEFLRKSGITLPKKTKEEKIIIRKDLLSVKITNTIKIG